MSVFAQLKNREGPAFGGWLFEPSVSALRSYYAAGFDYVGVDCQHSSIDEARATELIGLARDLGRCVLARVSENAAAPIGRLLDAGAHAVIVPGVDTAQEAAAAVAACRYPPRGKRSFGPLRADLGFSPEAIEAGAECLVMIETADGMRNLEAIAATPGLGGIYIGPADLAIGLGKDPGQAFGSTELAEQFARIAEVCQEKGLLLGAHAAGADSARHWIEAGCGFVSLGGNTTLFAQAAAQLAAELRGGPTARRAANSPYS